MKDLILHLSLIQIAVILGSLSLLTTLGFLSALFYYRRRFLPRYLSVPLDFPGDKSQFAIIDGVKLHYVVEGQGYPIILLHGIAANIFCWRFLIPLLSPKYQVWAIDLKGFGLSDKPKGATYGLKSQSELIIKFMDHFKINEFAAVGNSMGGAIAAEMALDHPKRVRELILLNSAHDPSNIAFDLRRLRRFVTFFAPFVNHLATREFVKLIYGPSFKVTDEAVRAYLKPYFKSSGSSEAFVEAFDALLDPTLIERLKTLQKRILILWGKNDRIIPLKHGKELHDILPKSEFYIHPQAGHHLQEEDPQWLSDRIQSFIESKN